MYTRTMVGTTRRVGRVPAHVKYLPLDAHPSRLTRRHAIASAQLFLADGIVLRWCEGNGRLGLEIARFGYAVSGCHLSLSALSLVRVA